MRTRSFLFCLLPVILFSFMPILGQPELAARFLDTTGADITFRGVEEKDGWVYALRRDAELFVFDTRSTLFNPDPSAGPIEEPLVFDSPERHFSLGGYYGNGLLRYGNVMYAFGGDGMVVLDLTDPSNPTRVGDAVSGFSSNLRGFRISPIVDRFTFIAEWVPDCSESFGMNQGPGLMK